MTESYVLFSAFSSGSGARNRWSAPGRTDGTTPGSVDGIPTLVAAPAFDAFDRISPIAQDFGGRANLTETVASLDAISDGEAAFASSFIGRSLNDGRAFTGGGPGPFNPTVLGKPDGFLDGSAFGFSLADRDWNGVKNIEVNLDSEDLAALSLVRLRNFVDVRVKLGDGPVATPDQDGMDPRFVSVVIENAKRGTVDASDSAFALDLTITTAIDGRNGQLSFDVVASGVDDLLVVMQGDHAGLTFQGYDLRTDGRDSLIVARMGAGNDTVIAFDTNAAMDVSGGADTGEITITTIETVLGAFTSVDVVVGDIFALGAGGDTVRYVAGDGVDQVIGFDAARDRLVIDADLMADAVFIGNQGNTVILFEPGPLATPGSSTYGDGLFIEAAVLDASDIIWV